MTSSLARVVLVTHPTHGAAELARALVERRLAACVNLIAARSCYRWEGALEECDESLLVVKTATARLEELRAAIAALHPQRVPEMVALEPAWVEPRYLDWLCGETRATS
jgi:periplasmic divalent cation tolerance protein